MQKLLAETKSILNRKNVYVLSTSLATAVSAAIRMLFQSTKTDGN